MARIAGGQFSLEKLTENTNTNSLEQKTPKCNSTADINKKTRI
jgi:hypothetical protein